MSLNMKRANYHLKMQELYWYLMKHRFIDEERGYECYKKHAVKAACLLQRELSYLKKDVNSAID